MLILLIVIDFSFKELISSLGPFYEVLCRRYIDVAAAVCGSRPPTPRQARAANPAPHRGESGDTDSDTPLPCPP